MTLLDISDFHGQLPPLSAAADDIDAEGAVSSSFDVGGVAFLAPWFDRYREEARGETLLVTAGDAVGATPPISSIFGDLPTIEAMNALGFSADSLGNHNFDAGAANMFENLAPVANFPYLSVNLVPARADATPVAGDPPFLPSLLLDVEGVSVGLIGFSNPDIPQLTRPGALDPYRVIDPVEPINAEAARLREQGADVIIAMGHMGATGGTLTDPTGPVVDVTDQLEGVDAVVGDHTDVQVSAVRPNGIIAGREPLEGRDVHPGAARRRRRARRAGLPHRRPPPALEHRRHSRPGDRRDARAVGSRPGPNAGASHRVGGATDSARRRLRYGDRAHLRIADRQHHHRRVADDVRHGFRHHQLRGYPC